jgi:hypothetical protein
MSALAWREEEIKSEGGSHAAKQQRLPWGEQKPKLILNGTYLSHNTRLSEYFADVRRPRRRGPRVIRASPRWAGGAMAGWQTLGYQ